MQRAAIQAANIAVLISIRNKQCDLLKTIITRIRKLRRKMEKSAGRRRSTLEEEIPKDTLKWIIVFSMKIAIIIFLNL